MWSQPHTAAQKAYYSVHAAKRRVYGVIMTILQALHGSLAFAAWVSIITWSIGNVFDAPGLFRLLAIIALVTFHALFRVTWMTYWYDRMDNDTATDSTIMIPVVLMAILLYTESRGAQIFLERQVKPVAELNASMADSTHRMYTSEIDQREGKARAASKSAFQDKIAAVALPYDNKIGQLRRRRTTSEEEVKYVKSLIRAQEQARDAAVAPIRNAAADSMMSITNRFAAQRDRADHQVTMEREKVTIHNTLEQSRYQSDLGNVGTYAWLISAVLLLLISLLGYAQVRINVNSGILPLRTYTVLDAHGGVMERLWTAVTDIFNRRTLQFAVWLHRYGSPNKPLTSFDGTVVAQPGSYNTHPGFFPATNPLLHPTVSDEDARQKVAIKAAQYVAQNPGAIISAGDMEQEMHAAKQMNGSYLTTPWGNQGPTAHTTEKTHASVPQKPFTVPQQETGILPVSPDDVAKYHLSELRKEPSNFSNQEANTQTVMDRVVKKIVKASDALKQFKYGDVSADVCLNFHKFLFQKILPHLSETYAQREFSRLDKVLTGLYDAPGKEGRGDDGN